MGERNDGNEPVPTDEQKALMEKVNAFLAEVVELAGEHGIEFALITVATDNLEGGVATFGQTLISNRVSVGDGLEMMHCCVEEAEDAVKRAEEDLMGDVWVRTH
jgi:hypothetical protein